MDERCSASCERDRRQHRGNTLSPCTATSSLTPRLLPLALRTLHRPPPSHIRFLESTKMKCDEEK
ncbi:hypothetical protein EYF80_028054 [Liparis tanakae]|uniref:Uncharacterized protein n=1 Tax=Liparis tanakae TaxID=230148 RepID=A0A4Z2HA79_9TELE|nr:hypothetical protein EYF80_028054 [Liparis tanakae]